MGFLFFRNTHTGPDFKEFRKDLGVSHRRTLQDGSTAIGFFILHGLEHKKGKTFDEIVAEIREYEAQFLEGPMQIQDILQELLDSINATVIRVEEKGLDEKKQEETFCRGIQQISHGAL